MIKENQKNNSGGKIVKRKDFDRILIKEGVKSKIMRDDLWRTKPEKNLYEKKLRRASRAFKRLYPWACKE